MYKDLTGQRFGTRVVLRRNGINEWREATWLALCDCGEESTTTTGSLRKSDRCMSCKANGFTAMPSGEAAFNRLIHKYKKHAKERGLFWDIADDEFRKLTKQHCYYCGCAPDSVFEARSRGSSGKNGYEDYIYNGVDRLDNDCGYLPGNVVSCCKMCNFAKRDIPASDFEAWILRAAHHIKERKT